MKLLEETLRESGVTFVPANGALGPGVVVSSELVGLSVTDDEI